MAFLTTEASAASDDEFGRGGRGYIKTSWHRMPDAQVKTLVPSDSLGDVEISWKLISFEGVKAYLTVGEARTLRDNLTAAITAVDTSGTDNEVGDVAIVNEDDTTPAPQWVRGAQKHGLPDLFGKPKARENRSGTTGPKGVA